MRPCQEGPKGCGVAGGSADAASEFERREGSGDGMPGRHRQFRRPHRLQQPGQLSGFVPELPANLGDAGRLAFRFERRDQIAQPRAQTSGVERFVLGQDREIAEKAMEAPQPARLGLRHALAGAAPLGSDLMIGKGEARVAELQQPQTQKAGDLNRAMRIILDARERRSFARSHPPRKMLEARERGGSESASFPVPNSFRKPIFSICASRLVGPLPGGTALSHSRRLIPPSSICANSCGSHLSRSDPATAAMVLNSA